MADEKALKKEANKDVAPKEGKIDITKRVKLIATKKAPYHEEDEEFEVAAGLVDSFVKRGFAKKA